MITGPNPNSTVLVAEDDDDARYFLKRAFQAAGIQCSLRFINDGEEVIDYLDGKGSYADRLAHPFPEMVLLDVKMPRLDGFEVLKWIRRNGRMQRLIVIMLTSSEEASDIDQAYALGANSYLTKCPDLDEFVELVKSIGSYWLKHNRPPEFPPADPLGAS